MTARKPVKPSRQWAAICLNSLTVVDSRKQQLFSSHTHFFPTRAKARAYARQFANGFVAQVREQYS